MPPILIIPGLGGSGPEHWQSLWQESDPSYSRVEQRDWDRPDIDEWVAILDGSVRGAQTPPVLVAHSLGCALVAHWAAASSLPVAGAMMVSPSDVDSPDHTPDDVRCFSPMPLQRLPFPSLVIASTNDPYVAFNRATHFATCWGAQFKSVGAQGHINAASGLESWQEGKNLLNAFCDLVNAR